jgi:hypothetical protein
MLRVAVVVGAALAAALPGCLTSGYVSTTYFDSPGAFPAALAAGAEVDEAPPGIPFAAADLDAVWEPGRYALRELRWTVVAPGTFDPTVENQGTTPVTVTLSPDYFMVDQGYARREAIEGPLHSFLENTTRLDARERQAAIDRLHTPTPSKFICDCRPEDVGLGMDDFDVSELWVRIGGLAATRAGDAGFTFVNPAPGYDDPVGTWEFKVENDRAVLGGGWFDSTRAEVLSSDVVHFRWVTEEREGDASADRKLRQALEGTGIAIPPPGNLAWVHDAADA